MKKTLSSIIVAGMIVNAVPSIIPVNVVNAAQVTKAQSTTVKTSNVAKASQAKTAIQYVFVDGKTQMFTAINVNGKILYSAKEIAKTLNAQFTYNTKTKTYIMSGNGNTVTFKRQDSSILANKESMDLIAPVTVYANQTFIDLEPVVQGLGGDVVTNSKTKVKTISTKGLVAGTFTGTKWINANTIMFTDEEFVYLFDVKTRSVAKKHAYNELSVSPDGKKALFTNEEDLLQLLDLTTGTVTQISTDDNYKAEFNWAMDNTTVYFLLGEKTQTVAAINITTGQISKILDDKVDYKTDLVVANNGNQIFYSVGKTGVTKYTDSARSDVDTIDLEGTEPQIHLLDRTIETAKPIAISATKENKFFTSLLPSGHVIYLAVDADNEEKLPELRMITPATKTETSLVTDKQIDTVSVSNKGNVYLLVTESDDSSTIYKLNTATKALEKIVSVADGITEFAVSADEKQIIVNHIGEEGEIISVFKNGGLEALTKN